MRRNVTVLNALALLLCLAVAAPFATPAYAVQPDEVLEDPVLESRARELSKGLRCVVCQNESIDESNADLARELRLVVRERLVAGDSDEQVLDYLVARYGEFVLLKPRTDGWNIILWLSGPALFLLALGIGVAYVRGRASASAPTEARLSEEEQARLKELLKES
ncbi:cytochrome c-type biogenesis protein [Marivita sp. XM-24bin2]|jgi:cytochrome c-type biogenesis protein CcmH|uniref:cytochrome c-type biogenesis protein n=1 Tax=unclassified Marivita TaxID=2632480 RepID=UPI000D7AD104|nr:cytochrome c-type biogenesis protein [Marivita sp. XM-24bin2]MCR9108743.1 cytochrome c-type biogenesis protein CcmH [Paracoccaceae bacterium]PWL35930.1 MAG: cytochrome C biogenesis protein CcdA [Marivita sp. XM-24bin2]